MWPNKYLSWLAARNRVKGTPKMALWLRKKQEKVQLRPLQWLSQLFISERTHKDILRCYLINLSSTTRTSLCLQNSHGQLHSVTFITTSSTGWGWSLRYVWVTLCWQGFFSRFGGDLFFTFILFTFVWICQRKSSRVDKFDYPSFKVYFWAYCIHPQCNCYSFTVIFSNTELSIHETFFPLSPMISMRHWNFLLSSLHLMTS